MFGISSCIISLLNVWELQMISPVWPSYADEGNLSRCNVDCGCSPSQYLTSYAGNIWQDTLAIFGKLCWQYLASYILGWYLANNLLNIWVLDDSVPNSECFILAPHYHHYTRANFYLESAIRYRGSRKGTKTHRAGVHYWWVEWEWICPLRVWSLNNLRTGAPFLLSWLFQDYL